MPAEINRPPILVKSGLTEVKDGYMLYKCPFCEVSPDQPDSYGYTVCNTKGCAIRGKPIKREKWNRRAEIVEKKLQHPTAAATPWHHYKRKRFEDKFVCEDCGVMFEEL